MAKKNREENHGQTALKPPEPSPTPSSRKYYESLLRNLPIGVSILRGNRTFSYFNPTYTKILGYELADLPDEKAWFEKAFPATAYRARVISTWKQDLTLLATEEHTERIFRVRCKSGHDKVILFRNFYFDEGCYCTTYTDLTEKKNLEEQLFQSQKMEAIGTLAGGIAHDFNNILSAIFGNTELALLKTGPDSQTGPHLRQILKAGARARDLVSQILSFSRKTEKKTTPLWISPIVKETLKLLRASLPATIEINQDHIYDCGAVKADPTQIHQVTMNLCTNAYHAIGREPGRIDVRLETITVAEHSLETFAGARAGKCVLLSVRDTGCGMSEELKKRIFEPYFTTRDKGTGTGLGLSVVHGIVKNLKGAVFVKSSPGKGTLISVYLPQAAASAAETARMSVQMPRGNEHILLVDDEPDIADINRQMLEHLGYRVTVATESPKALVLFAEQPKQFDLILSDLTMPRITGDRLARKVLRIRPDIPVILCSGISEKSAVEEAHAAGARGVIPKPADLKTLSATIRQVLDGSNRP